MNRPVKVTVTRKFPVTAERVYDAWLSPDWLGRWMYGPAVRDERVVRLGLEPRVGGRFSFLVNRGGKEVEHTGEYLELDHPLLLVFTWATRDTLPEGSRVIVEITPDGAGCELTLTQVLGADRTDFAIKAEGAWRQMFEALATALPDRLQSVA